MTTNCRHHHTFTCPIHMCPVLYVIGLYIHVLRSYINERLVYYNYVMFIIVLYL